MIIKKKQAIGKDLLLKPLQDGPRRHPLHKIQDLAKWEEV